MERIIAPCGIDCFNCEMYEKNITEEFKKRISAQTKVPQEMLSCKGCIDGNICSFLKVAGKSCKTLECVQQKGVDYCFNCDDFPCKLLMPLADRADKFPQNIKLYNLCMMKKIGVEKWADMAKDIRKDYFTKPLNIGEGASE